jgi:UDPglucose 6-dehydrogenase
VKIGIAGMGFVGKNLFRYFKEQNLDPVGYDIDPQKSTGGWFDLINCNLIFLCLPTPYKEGKKGFDTSIINETLKQLSEYCVTPTVIIKSTVWPGTTEMFQKKYPNLKLGFVPEFLTERYAWEDTLHPDTSVFGYTDKSHSIANDVLQILPEASYERIIPATEAEMVKLARNNYFVNKIVFMNMLYDVCQSQEIDYELVKDALASDRRIRRSHMEIFHQGGRGGAGTCFTKDTPAFRDYVDLIGGDAAKFVDLYCKINQKLIKESGKDTGRQYG